jgi:putative transposase
LTLVDEQTRECLVLHATESISGAEVRRIIARVIGRRGAPTKIRSDNGSEFVCEALSGWLSRKGSESIPVAPGSPWQNGDIESFHGELRDDCLERVEFDTVSDAVEETKWHRREYNTVCPHSALGYKTPKVFSVECDEKSSKKEPREIMDSEVSNR